MREERPPAAIFPTSTRAATATSSRSVSFFVVLGLNERHAVHMCAGSWPPLDGGVGAVGAHAAAVVVDIGSEMRIGVMNVPLRGWPLQPRSGPPLFLFKDHGGEMVSIVAVAVA